MSLRRDQLLAMKLTTAVLPIACTEGWSTTQTWTGVRLAELAALAGVDQVRSATLESITGDGHDHAVGGAGACVGKSLLALRVNGADLSLDHGYPARVIVPSAPGTYNRKWMQPHHLHRGRADVSACAGCAATTAPARCTCSSLIACLAFVGYIVTRIHARGRPDPDRAPGSSWRCVLHDLVSGRCTRWLIAARCGSPSATPSGCPACPGSTTCGCRRSCRRCLLGISLPLVLRRSQASYYAATGLTESVYFGRWLLVTGALFALSAVLYAVRLGVAARHQPR